MNMKIGICDDNSEEIVKVRKLIEETKFLDDELLIEEYNPDSLLMDITEEFFDCQILITDIYFGEKRVDGKSYDGVDMSKIINEKYPHCKIIFISQYMDFTEYVYQADHIYFILKKNMEHFLGEALKKAVKAYNDDAREKFIDFFHKSKRTWVKLRDIFSIEKVDRNIKIMTDKEDYICIKSLKKIADEVQDEPIVRCNNATLVNLRHVKTISSRKIVLENDNEYEISDTYGDSVKKAYLKWWKGRT